MIEKIDMPEDLVMLIDNLAGKRNTTFNDVLLELVQNTLSIYESCAEMALKVTCNHMFPCKDEVCPEDREKAIKFLMATETVARMVDKWYSTNCANLKNIKIKE